MIFKIRLFDTTTTLKFCAKLFSKEICMFIFKATDIFSERINPTIFRKKILHLQIKNN